MKWNEVFCHTFKAMRKEIEPAVRKQVDFLLPSLPMIEACRADDFDFFHPFIDAGKLTTEQMHNAAERYHLGKTKSGQPIFWMIDDMLTPLDAHIGTDAWISTLLKAREPLLKCWQVQHCPFGLHLSPLPSGLRLYHSQQRCGAEQRDHRGRLYSESRRGNPPGFQDRQSLPDLYQFGGPFPGQGWKPRLDRLHGNCINGCGGSR